MYSEGRPAKELEIQLAPLSQHALEQEQEEEQEEEEEVIPPQPALPVIPDEPEPSTSSIALIDRLWTTKVVVLDEEPMEEEEVERPLQFDAPPSAPIVPRVIKQGSAAIRETVLFLTSKAYSSLKTNEVSVGASTGESTQTDPIHPRFSSRSSTRNLDLSVSNHDDLAPSGASALSRALPN